MSAALTWTLEALLLCWPTFQSGVGGGAGPFRLQPPSVGGPLGFLLMALLVLPLKEHCRAWVDVGVFRLSRPCARCAEALEERSTPHRAAALRTAGLCGCPGISQAPSPLCVCVCMCVYACGRACPSPRWRLLADAAASVVPVAPAGGVHRAVGSLVRSWRERLSGVPVCSGLLGCGAGVGHRRTWAPAGAVPVWGGGVLRGSGGTECAPRDVGER